MHAFDPASPLSDPAWIHGFDQRGGYASLARFYLRHPRVALRLLWKDLTETAWQIRAENLSNFRREDGHPAHARTNRFASWSSLRAWQLTRWPALMIVWYAALLVGAPLAAWRGPSRIRAIAWSLFFAASLGLGEFCFASLTDALETYRHLLLFHLFTDFSIWFALCAMAAFAAERPVRMQSGMPMPS